MVNYSSRNLIKDCITFYFLLLFVNTRNISYTSSTSFLVFLLRLFWEGTNENSFNWGIQIILTLSIYFLRFLHSGHGNSLCIWSFLFVQVTLFCSLFLTSQDFFFFARCVSAIYFFGKLELQSFGLLLLRRGNCFPTLTFEKCGRRKRSLVWDGGSLFGFFNNEFPCRDNLSFFCKIVFVLRQMFSFQAHTSCKFSNKNLNPNMCLILWYHSLWPRAASSLAKFL